MARPKNQDVAETKSRILSVAGELFARRGFGNTSVRDVAKKSDLALATVTHHFGAKAALYEACIDETYAQVKVLHDELRTHFEAVGFTLDAFDDALRLSFRFARKRRHTVQLILREVVNSGEVPRQRLDGFLLPFLEDGLHFFALHSPHKPERIRMSLHTLNHLVVRYALMSDDEAAHLVTAHYKLDEQRQGQHPIDAIEAHLVFCASALLGIERSTD